MWSSTCRTFCMAWTTTTFTVQLTRDVGIFKHVRRQIMDSWAIVVTVLIFNQPQNMRTFWKLVETWQSQKRLQRKHSETVVRVSSSPRDPEWCPQAQHQLPEYQPAPGIQTHQHTDIQTYQTGIPNSSTVTQQTIELANFLTNFKNGLKNYKNARFSLLIECNLYLYVTGVFLLCFYVSRMWYFEYDFITK